MEIKPVGGKAPNPSGVHDMAGLVWEWYWDRFAAYPEKAQAPLRDATGPLQGDTRVVRGGSFGAPPGDLRSAERSGVQPELRRAGLGLRCVRSRAREP